MATDPLPSICQPCHALAWEQLIRNMVANLVISWHATAQDATSVVIMKFDTGRVDASAVTAAILTLHVSFAGGGNNQFLVLGLPGTCRQSVGRVNTSRAVQTVLCLLLAETYKSRSLQ